MVETSTLTRFFRFDRVFGLLVVGSRGGECENEGMWLAASACPGHSRVFGLPTGNTFQVEELIG